ncbi:DUF58 domain-containing protein [Janthinobacterium sp. Mn2066]|uniref:DUF58 domain-containing protein n=1 Tax=Janthinobacterium sp. Mn2066 TaxID=3395264 RepID=UPI003BD01F5D
MRPSGGQWRRYLPVRPWLGAHRVHIRPSRAGLAFGALLLALWIAAVNFQLGLGYALTCFAAACAIVDMLFASRNLAGLALAATPGQAVFAGDSAAFELRLINRSSRSRHAIALSAGTGAQQQADVPAHGESTTVIHLATTRRGWLEAPSVRLSSGFPLGLFYAWCWWQPEARVLVLPRPESPCPPLPASMRQAQERQEELAGVRAYQPGDPQQRLAWRQIARHDGDHLYSKHFQDAAAMHGALLLDLATLPATLEPEARLSRLAAWVLAAERAGLPYGLRLDGLTLAPGLGLRHQEACLRALAEAP